MQGMEACVVARGDAGSRAGSGQRTRGDPRVQAQSLHQHVVQEHGHQRHQDVGEAHVKHNRGSCGRWGDAGEAAGAPGSPRLCTCPHRALLPPPAPEGLTAQSG